ncbi:MAG: ankyrin repeat domain-containing protein [Blastocatellia bacterium]
MTKSKLTLILLILLGLIYFNYNKYLCLNVFSSADSGPIDIPADQSSWEKVKAVNFPAWIVLETEAKSPPAFCEVFLYFEPKYYTRENLTKLFSEIAKRYPAESWLEFTVFTDKKMLNAGLVEFRSQAISLPAESSDSGTRADQDSRYTNNRANVPTGGSAFARFHKSSKREFIELFPAPESKKYESIIIRDELSRNSSHGRFRLSQAVIANDEEQIRLLIKHEDINVRDDLGWTPLLYAVRYNFLGISTILLEAGNADAGRSSSDGISPLILAAQFCELEMIRLLVEHGADLNGRDKSGNTCLMVAAANGRGEIVDYLIGRGANVRIKNYLGQTALMNAWDEIGKAEMSQRLLKAGIGINEQDNEGDTALMYAVRTGNEVKVRVLIDQGAKIKVRNREGQTAIDYAKLNNFTEIHKLLLNRQ